jgi:hypothetical protein
MEYLMNISPGNGKRLSKAYIDREPALNNTKPNGPFRPSGEGHEGDLLIFVPRNTISRVIDRMTGGYGYSHLAIDCGEIDQPTSRHVMIEATMSDVVHYAYQDEYGERPFVRIPLKKTGVNVGQFCECVHSRLGEKYGDMEVLTLGILDNPARQICSDLATNCLPEEMRKEFVSCHRATVIHPLSVVLHEKSATALRLFISPNGFVEYFGAPRGKDLEGPDQLVEPHPQDSRSAVGISPKIWKHGVALLMHGWRRLTSW